jgi:hypothetical protein
MARTIFRRAHSARGAERFSYRLAPDSFRREALGDAWRVAERAAFGLESSGGLGYQSV